MALHCSASVLGEILLFSSCLNNQQESLCTVVTKALPASRELASVTEIEVKQFRKNIILITPYILNNKGTLKY